MKTSYKREMRSNYLILEPEHDVNGYEHRMLLSNHIEGLLKFRVKQTDNKCLYYYDITSRQPLNRLIEAKAVNKKEIQEIILGVGNVLSQLERYLLKEERILLDPEYIYVEPETFTPYFCFVPERKGDFAKDLEKMLQYILKNVDHQDRDSVVLAYSLYQESQKEWYGIENLLQWIYKDTETEEEPFLKQYDNLNQPEQYYSEQYQPEHNIRKVESSLDRHSVILPQEQTERKKRWIVLGAVLYMIGSPAALWILQGKNGIYRYGGILLLIDAVIVFVLMIGNYKKAVDEEMKKDIGDIYSEVYMEEDKESEEEWINQKEKEYGLEEAGTVLLANLEGKTGNHYLMSLDKDYPDIPVPYFPFVIGKQKNVVDYVLKKDTVSRLHVKLTKDDEGYLIRDLNSTNGTRVRGKLLESNEEARLYPGDEIYIAETGFRFLQ